MTQSSISPIIAAIPVFGVASAPWPATAEQIENPLTCLTGCTADHVREELDGWAGKQCHASVHTAAITPSYGVPRWLVGGFAATEGSLLMAEVGILREGDHEDRATYFDPAVARRFAVALLQAADQAEDLARTAVPVDAA